MNKSEYKHNMAAHCETGSIAGLLNNAGIEISEPMVFGIAGGIFFGYLETRDLPFPLIVTRSKPGDIRKYITKRIGVTFKKATFRNEAKAQESLDVALAQNIPVAVQLDMFYMEYIPSHMRIHFNGHFVVITKKEGDIYTVSDCYYPSLTQVDEKQLTRGRFAKGNLAPKGLMYYPVTIPQNIDLKENIIKGIRQACKNMIKLPIPFIGVKGIRRFAKKVVDWPKITRDDMHLSHQVMMINETLEERGTGGAGFRFMYASFLQEAAGILGNNNMKEMSKEMMAIGDRWREVSLFSARMAKNHDFGNEKFLDLQSKIVARADEEEIFFKKLLKITK